MDFLPEHLKTIFTFGGTRVQILAGDILNLGEPELKGGPPPQAVVTGEDNYLTMQRGVSRKLRLLLGADYAHQAQLASPVSAGSVLLSDLQAGDAAPVSFRYVLHAVVFDYDSSERPLEELVCQASALSLEKAAQSGVTSLAFPALGASSDALSLVSSARCLAESIKTFLAQERPLQHIYLALNPPSLSGSPEAVQRRLDKLVEFVREVNLVLDLPYDPRGRLRQERDFYGRREELALLKDLIAGAIPGKRHLALIGGPGMGKGVLLDQLYLQERAAIEGRFLARVEFTPLYSSTPPAFIYRKLISGMLRHEADPEGQRLLREIYADTGLDCEHFLQFLDANAERYGDLVFLVDGLPEMTPLEEGDSAASDPAAAGDPAIAGNPPVNTPVPTTADQVFYKDLDRLQRRVRFFFAFPAPRTRDAAAETLKLWGELAPEFSAGLELSWLRAMSDAGRREWVEALLQKYLGIAPQLPLEIQQFLEGEAGNHPYIISLAGFLLVERLKQYCLEHPEEGAPMERGLFLERSLLRTLAAAARKALEKPRQEFMDRLLADLPGQEALDLFNLGRAELLDEQRRLLGPALAAGDPNAQSRFAELLLQDDPRKYLHKESLEWLEQNGYLAVDGQGRQSIAIPALSAYAVERLGGFKRPEDRPTHVTIGLLFLPGPARKRKGGPPPHIRTLFDHRGARLVSAVKPFADEQRKEFMAGFSSFLSAQHLQVQPPAAGKRPAFRNAEEVGTYLLTQFAVLAVKRYLENPPPGCTINFLVDEAIQEIPWELMLEAAYAGEIPFRVGRSVISAQPPGNVRPAVRGPGSIQALLIGDPTGDLEAAAETVRWLGQTLAQDPRFEKPEVMIGPQECQRVRVMTALSSGRYGLVHYSGHSYYAKGSSAWVLSDGDLPADQITSAVQAGPPALVFSASCSSAAAGEVRQIEYENQAFDLPGAFLNGGVEAYLGTLWEVEAGASRRLVERFYGALISGEHSLGECLRQARQGLKVEQESQRQLDWLAFMLYGDARLRPDELYPAFRG